jgi:hypothetical protein
MGNPFFYTILLYLLLAMVGAADAALTSYQSIPFVNGLRWFRIHFVTLGVMTQTVFAVTPVLVAAYADKPRPRFRGDIWALLNVGIVTLVYGIPLINNPMILTGGVLIFIAPLYNQLHATAYALWGLALLPIAYESWRVAQAGIEGRET